MILRMIQIINNFYRDNTNQSNESLGEYCAFGCYDALHICDRAEYGKENNHSIREIINDSVMNAKTDWKCNSYFIPCITKDEKTDEDFWKNAETLPFLFFSLLRTKKTEASTDNNNKKLKPKDSTDPVMTYLTTEHSELAVFYATDSYSRGMKYISDLNRMENILKKYTIFATREDALNKNTEIYEKMKNEEIVECQLDAVVKNWRKVDSFIARLKEELNINNDIIKKRILLGSKDISIRIPKVNLKDLLCLYKMGSLLTHSNKEFGDTFFNIETQFLEIKSGEEAAE